MRALALLLVRRQTSVAEVPTQGAIPLKQPGFCDTIARLVGTRCGGVWLSCAEVAKLVDALDLGSSVLRRESSSLSFRTNLCLRLNQPLA